MTLQSIAERLKREFPGKCVWLTMEAAAYTAGATTCKMSLNTFDSPSIPCKTLEEGIARLHRQLNVSSPEIEVEV